MLQINIKDSYLQYTSKMSPMQRGRVEKALDKEYNYDRFGIVSIKNFLVNAYLSSYHYVYMQKNEITYNRRTGEENKPKDMYYIETTAKAPVHYTYSLNKTEYEFYLYLEKMKPTLKDIQGCLEIEERIERERIAQEKYEKEQLKQQKELERQERIKRGQQLRQEHQQKGLPIVEPFRAQLKEVMHSFLQANPSILNNSIMISNNDNINLTPEEYEAKLEGFTDELVQELSLNVGNPRLLKGKVDYYVTCSEEDYQRLGRNKDLYRNAIMCLTGIEPTDSGQTASAKIRALVNGTTYKPSAPKKVYEFYRFTQDKGYERTEGEAFVIQGVRHYIAKVEDKYALIEPVTGLTMITNSIRQSLINNIKKTSYYTNAEFFHKKHRQIIDSRNGELAPIVDNNN